MIGDILEWIIEYILCPIGVILVFGAFFAGLALIGGLFK